MPVKVEVDWAKDGTFTAPGDNVTARIRPLTGTVTAEYGRDQSTALAPTMAGTAGVVLDNRSRDYSPRNTASPLYGKLRPARPVRITRTVGATTYTLFTGHTDDTPINPDVDSRTVALSMVDGLADFRGQNITTPLYRGIRTGEAIGYVLDACGWSSTLRDLDPGSTVCPWWWEDGTDALTALDKIVRSEGPPALLTVGTDGSIVFRDRHHRLTRTESTTSQGTWRGAGPIEPVMGRPFVYDEAWRNIVNTAATSIDVRTLGALQVIWTSDTTIDIADGETKLVTAAVSEPFSGAVAPVAGTDYVLTSGTVETSLLRTSGSAATIVLKAVGGAAKVSTLQLRAQPLAVAYTVQISETDTASVGEFGARNFPGDLPWCNPYDAEAVLETVVALRADPLPILSTRFMVGKNTTKAGLLLPRDLSDRVRVKQSETVLDHDFYIETIRHELTGEDDHAVTFGLEAVPTPISPVFRFGVAGQGFAQGKFGSTMLTTRQPCSDSTRPASASIRPDLPTEGEETDTCWHWQGWLTRGRTGGAG